MAEFGALIGRFVEPESQKPNAFLVLSEYFKFSLIFDTEASPEVCWNRISVSISFNFSDLCVDAGNKGRSIENRVDLVDLVDSEDSAVACFVNIVVNVFRSDIFESGDRFSVVYFENILVILYIQSKL